MNYFKLKFETVYYYILMALLIRTIDSQKRKEKFRIKTAIIQSMHTSINYWHVTSNIKYGNTFLTSAFKLFSFLLTNYNILFKNVQ